jgi:hypothetical protein
MPAHKVRNAGETYVAKPSQFPKAKAEIRTVSETQSPSQRFPNIAPDQDQSGSKMSPEKSPTLHTRSTHGRYYK